MQNFSPNMLKIFEQCPKKFELKYVEKINLPQNSKFFEKGKNLHALASYFLQGFDIEKMEKALGKDEKKLWTALKTNKYFQLNSIQTEYNLSCKIGKFWVGGRLDAFVCEGSDYYILDYKTGSIPQNPQEDFQTIIYLLSVDKLLAGNYNSLRFVYLGLKDNEDKIIELTEELKNKYEKKVIETLKKVELNIFKKNQNNCKHCEYLKICNG